MSSKKNKLKIDKERCKGCFLCIEFCPRKALSVSETVNKKGYRYVVMKDATKCNLCGICVMMCPDCGIEIVEE